MNIDDFFRDDGVTKFINRMCALLNINDTSRVKVVGVYAGSVEVTTFIEPAATPLTDSTTVNDASQAAAVAAIQSTITAAISDGSLSSVM
jgi:hypothetical protein